MFAFQFATILAAATAVIAHPTIRTRGGESGCSTGSLQCCDSIAPAGSSDHSILAGVLPIGMQGTNAPLGANCIPVDSFGGGTAGTCSTQASCCNGVHNGGAVPIGVGCSPANFGF